MKNITGILAITVAVCCRSPHALAQATAPGSSDYSSVNAGIITPIIIVKNVDMSFGNVAASPSLPGTVVLSPGNVRTVGGAGGVTLPANTGVVNAARFTVSGQGHYTYAITLPASCIIKDAADHTMVVTNFISDPVSGNLSASASQVLQVGATLHVNAAQAVGVYFNASGMPVTVNYN